MVSMVRSRVVSPLELVRAHLEQIERANPRINAFVSVLAEEALAKADQLATRQEGGAQRRNATSRWMSVWPFAGKAYRFPRNKRREEY